MSVPARILITGKRWLEEKLKHLAANFGIDLLAFSCMSNHLGGPFGGGDPLGSDPVFGFGVHTSVYWEVTIPCRNELALGC